MAGSLVVAEVESTGELGEQEMLCELSPHWDDGGRGTENGVVKIRLSAGRGCGSGSS